MIDNIVGNTHLALAVEILLTCSRDNAYLVFVRLEAGPFVTQRIEHDEIQVLLLPLKSQEKLEFRRM